MSTEPRYQHDCDQCRFIGKIDKYDMWICEKTDRVSVIARYGSNGEYASRGFMEPFIEAVQHETAGLSTDQGIVLAAFRAMPSLLLNITQWRTA